MVILREKNYRYKDHVTAEETEAQFLILETCQETEAEFLTLEAQPVSARA